MDVPESRNDIEDEHAAQVEEEMHERNLERGLTPRAVRRQAGDDARRRRADVGAQRERIGPLQADQPRPRQRRQGRREHAAGLQQEGEQGAYEHGQVAGGPGHVGQVGVDAGLHEAGDAAADDAVEDADHGEEAGAHEDEGDGGEEKADGGVGEAEALGAQVGQQVAAGGGVVRGTAAGGEDGAGVLVGGIIACPAFQHLNKDAVISFELNISAKTITGIKCLVENEAWCCL